MRIGRNAMALSSKADVELAQIVLTAISPFVVGLFGKRHAEQPDWEYATGVALEFEGVKFILTAAHVVSFRPVDFVFVPPPSSGFLFSASSNRGRFAKSERWDAIHCVGDEDPDLAAILFRTPPQIQFFSIDRDAATPRTGREVAICGYPIASSKAAQDDSGEVRDLALPDFQFARVLDRPSLNPNQFAIDYPQIPGIVRPSGYSGSMVWYDDACCRTLEELREGLVVAAAGIVTDHLVSEQALVCTRIESVIEFVDHEVIPKANALRKVIDDGSVAGPS